MYNFIDYYICFFAIFNIIDFYLSHETLKRYIKRKIYIYNILSDNGKNKILMYKIKYILIIYET